MLKKILNLEGSHILGKKQQSAILGGYICHPSNPGVGYGVCSRPAPNPNNCYFYVECGGVCPNGSKPIC